MDPTQDDRRNRPSLLVIDDDPNGLRLLIRLLTQAGYEPVAAFGAEDALRKLSRRRYDVALIELAMKQVSGIRLIEMIKADAVTADTRVLAVTSPIRRSLMRQLGCEGFVFRPVEPAQLVRAIEEVREQHGDHPPARPDGCGSTRRFGP